MNTKYKTKFLLMFKLEIVKFVKSRKLQNSLRKDCTMKTICTR